MQRLVMPMRWSVSQPLMAVAKRRGLAMEAFAASIASDAAWVEKIVRPQNAASLITVHLPVRACSSSLLDQLLPACLLGGSGSSK